MELGHGLLAAIVVDVPFGQADLFAEPLQLFPERVERGFELVGSRDLDFGRGGRSPGADDGIGGSGDEEGARRMERGAATGSGLGGERIDDLRVFQRPEPPPVIGNRQGTGGAGRVGDGAKGFGLRRV